MFEIGRVCIKIAGRDAGQTAIVVDESSKEYVIIDGNVRRKKCNLKHLEPLKDVIKIKKGASTTEVHKAMINSKIKVIEKKQIKRTKKSSSDKKQKITKKSKK